MWSDQFHHISKKNAISWHIFPEVNVPDLLNLTKRNLKWFSLSYNNSPLWHLWIFTEKQYWRLYTFDPCLNSTWTFNNKKRKVHSAVKAQQNFFNNRGEDETEKGELEAELGASAVGCRRQIHAVYHDEHAPLPHPVQDTLAALPRSFSNTLPPPKCEKETPRRLSGRLSFLQLLHCTMSSTPIEPSQFFYEILFFKYYFYYHHLHLWSSLLYPWDLQRCWHVAVS